jgi:hypothetical protein
MEVIPDFKSVTLITFLKRNVELGSTVGVAKDELIEINLELTPTDAVVGPKQPLLQVANRPVCQRYHRFGSFPQFSSQGLDARHVLETRLLQTGEALKAIGMQF